jgi:hypothetical protein
MCVAAAQGVLHFTSSFNLKLFFVGAAAAQLERPA